VENGVVKKAAKETSRSQGLSVVQKTPDLPLCGQKGLNSVLRKRGRKNLQLGTLASQEKGGGKPAHRLSTKREGRRKRCRLGGGHRGWKKGGKPDEEGKATQIQGMSMGCL